MTKTSFYTSGYTSTNNGDEISFMNVDLFIRIAISTTKINDCRIPMDFTNKLHNLCKLTSLSNLTLVQALFYLKSIQSVYTRKEGFNELFRKVSLLLMIANKYLDDYSFNLKTWINLTNLSKEFIVSQEIKFLKTLNYDLNAMFKQSRYNDFIDELKRHVYTPLTPDSPTVEINNIGALFSYEPQAILPNICTRQPVPVESSFTTPPYSNSLTYSHNFTYNQQTIPQPASFSTTYQYQPSTMIPSSSHTATEACYPYSVSVCNSNAAPTYSQYSASAFTQVPVRTLQVKKRPYDAPYSNESYDTASLHKSKRLTHQGDCECCNLTNAANDYYSAVQNQVSLEMLPLPLVPVVCNE